jgi:hypothetical protein
VTVPRRPVVLTTVGGLAAISCLLLHPTASAAVTVLLGDADGRVGEGGRDVLTRASLGETPRTGDHFGFDVALAASGHHHRCADLLVGAPGVDEPGAADAGMAYAISDVPDAEGNPQLEAFVLTQADAGGVAEAGDQLGYAVAITGLNQEDRRRLVVGARARRSAPRPAPGR